MAGRRAVRGLVAALKVKFGTNETLLTLMFNYVALYFLIFLGETKAEWNFFLDLLRPSLFANFSKDLASFPRHSPSGSSGSMCA